MNISQILRGLLDVIERNQAEDIEIDQVNKELTPVHVDNTDNTDDATMVPPLQQNLELLKRAVDVPNFFTDEEEQGCGDDESDTTDIELDDMPADDELVRIKQIAGVPTAAIVAMADGQTI
jgi:hypothetical protein